MSGKVLKFLSAAEILSAKDIETEVVEVPEWGGAVYVKGMTGAERDAFEKSILVEKRSKKGKVTRETDTANMRAKLVAATMVGDSGLPLFSPYDVEELGKKSGAALQRVFEVACKLSGMTEKEIDELGEDSAQTPSDGAVSASQ